MWNWCGALLDRVCIVVSALLFAQIPLFIQQYTQQLVGREAELRQQVEAMRNAASLSKKTLEQYIQKFISSSDLDFSHQGQLMQSLVERWQSFFDSLVALQNSSIYSKPFVFIQHVHLDVFQSAFHHSNFGLPLNIEGSLYALIGVLFGYICLHSAKALFSKARPAAQRKGHGNDRAIP